MISLILRDDEVSVFAPATHIVAVPMRIRIIRPTSNPIKNDKRRRIPPEMAAEFVGLEFISPFNADEYFQQVFGTESPYPPGTRLAYEQDVIEILQKCGKRRIAAYIETQRLVIGCPEHRFPVFHFAAETFEIIHPSI